MERTGGQHRDRRSSPEVHARRAVMLARISLLFVGAAILLGCTMQVDAFGRLYMMFALIVTSGMLSLAGLVESLRVPRSKFTHKVIGVGVFHAVVVLAVLALLLTFVTQG